MPGSWERSASNSWAFGEVFGWAHTLNLKIREAPWFYACYLLALVSAGAVVLIPGAPLVLITRFVQVIAVTLLPAGLPDPAFEQRGDHGGIQEYPLAEHSRHHYRHHHYCPVHSVRDNHPFPGADPLMARLRVRDGKKTGWLPLGRMTI